MENISENNDKLITKKIKNNNPLLTHYDNNPNIVEIGVDEVGRGPLFGRVYTAAVILPSSKTDTTNQFVYSNIKDSKKFHSKKKINEVADYIKENAISWSVAYMDESVIDDINILQATQMAMHKCINDIIVKNNLLPENTLLLIDGNYFNPITIFNKNTNLLDTYNYVCVEGGDNKYTSIAAASILAKVARDEYIEDLCKQHPELSEYYGIDSNKGYGAKKHLEGIKEHGITIWHRRSFGICKNYV
jgi:ribonuclease HII